MAATGSETPIAEASSEEVGYAVEHTLVTRPKGCWHQLFIALMYIGALVIAWLLVRSGLVAVGLSGTTRPVGWLILGTFVIAAIHWRDSLPRPAKGESVTVFSSVNDSRRVWCVWAKWRLQRLAGIAPIHDDGFEPEVFATPFAVPPTATTSVAWVLFSAGSFGVLYLVLHLFGHGADVKFHLLTFCCAFAMGWLALSAAMPTTLRVVPGRIDVMRGWFYSSKRPVVRTVDLRGRRVIVDVKSGFVFVGGAEREAEEALALIYGSASLRARIAHAILRAAISTAEPPPLPPDQATG